LCSFTSTFYSTPAGTGNNNTEETKYVDDLECLYVLGRNYKNPISNLKYLLRLFRN
jgi:hypothetical protein